MFLALFEGFVETPHRPHGLHRFILGRIQLTLTVTLNLTDTVTVSS